MAAGDYYLRGDEFAVLFDSKPDVYQPLNFCGGYGIKDVSATLSHKYDSKPADTEFESEKEVIWELRRKETPGLYNGSKFRLTGLECKGNCLTLYLGLTDYKNYVCTNMYEEKWRHIRETSLDRYGDERSCLADPLGVTAVVVSRDDQVVFMRRSHMVYESPGKVDTPGGHPEPSEVHVKHGKGNTQNPDLEEMDPRAVVHELFDSITREVRDEINIPECCMSQPHLLGIFRNRSTGGRPSLCFLINCSQSGKEIYENYQKGCPEAFESTEVLLVQTVELLAPEQTSEMRNLLPHLTGSCKACLYFYVTQMKGTKE